MGLIRNAVDSIVVIDYKTTILVFYNPFYNLFWGMGTKHCTLAVGQY